MVSGQSLPAVWFIQPSIQHYRVPVWDRVRALGAGRYDMLVFGEMHGGRAFHGPARDYFRELACRDVRAWGIQGQEWPGLLDIASREKPSVVIMAANIRSKTCWAFTRYAKARGIRTVAWSKVHSFSNVPSWILTPIKARFFSRFDRCIAYGQLAKHELMSLGISADRIDVAQNTIDTTRIFSHGESFRARGHELRSNYGLGGKKIVLCIARMDPEKRQDDLIKAWPKLRILDPSLRLVLVGGGQRLGAIREFAHGVDNDRVIVTGPAGDGDDYAWIATSDISVQPGAVGLAINQSLAFGVPTLIADEVGSDTEIVVHGQTGWRFPRGNLDALVQTIEGILRDTSGTAAITERGRSLMRDSVNLDSMAAAIDHSITQSLPAHPANK